MLNKFSFLITPTCISTEKFPQVLYSNKIYIFLDAMENFISHPRIQLWENNLGNVRWLLQWFPENSESTFHKFEGKYELWLQENFYVSFCKWRYGYVDDIHLLRWENCLKIVFGEDLIHIRWHRLIIIIE